MKVKEVFEQFKNRFLSLYGEEIFMPDDTVYVIHDNKIKKGLINSVIINKYTNNQYFVRLPDSVVTYVYDARYVYKTKEDLIKSISK